MFEARDAPEATAPAGTSIFTGPDREGVTVNEYAAPLPVRSEAVPLVTFTSLMVKSATDDEKVAVTLNLSSTCAGAAEDKVIAGSP